MTTKFVIAYLLLLFGVSRVIGQPDWATIFYPEVDAYGENIANSYDPGILVLGEHGSYQEPFNWLIKTDINGNIIWNKTIGHESSYILLAVLSYNQAGEFYLAGSTGFYNTNDYDPILLKLNACGEKEWCKVFYAEGINYINSLETTKDGGCIVLIRYLNPDISKDRLSLAKFSANGEMDWLRRYNSPDTNVFNEDAYDITICQDGGYLITGVCDYMDPNPPHYLWLKPYYIKVDSAGNSVWERVINTETNLPGGCAWNTMINPDSTCFYSSISRYHDNGDSPGLVKMSFSGEVIDVYDMVSPGYFGKHFQFVFLNDSTMAGSAIWGSQSTGVPKAILFDTLGNIIKSSYLIDNNYMSYVRKTYDGKLLFFTNDQDEQTYEFDAYLFKLDQELNDDTIYNYPFQYDTLCPYTILSDTITQEGCDIIVGIHDYDVHDAEEDLMEVYPNPAEHYVNIRYPVSNIRYSIHLYDTFGRLMDEIIVPSGQEESRVNLSDYPDGIYIAVLKDDEKILGRKKFVVVRE